MSKSNYEEWADQEQPKKLQSTATLAQAASIIRTNPQLSMDVREGMKLLTAQLFHLTMDEVERLTTRQKYWIV